MAYAGKIIFPAVRIQIGVLQDLEYDAVKLRWCRISELTSRTPPAARPYSALAPLVITCMSPIASTEGPMTNEVWLMKSMTLTLLSTPFKQEVIFARGANAVGRKAAAQRIARAVFSRHHAGRQTRQIGERALASQRQLGDLRWIQILRPMPDVSVCSSGASAVTSTVCVHVSDLQCEVHGNRVARSYDNSLLLRLLKSGASTVTV